MKGTKIFQGFLLCILMNLTATHLAYYLICKRKLWLFHHQISMEQNSDVVYEGKLIGENTYMQRPEKYTEISLSGIFDECRVSIKIDFFDAKNKVVHEIKKSDKLEKAHIAQTKFYIYLLEKNGVLGCTGIVEYPKLKQTHSIEALTDTDRHEIENSMREIQQILSRNICPALIKKSYCKTCSYFEFCFVE